MRGKSREDGVSGGGIGGRDGCQRLPRQLHRLEEIYVCMTKLQKEFLDDSNFPIRLRDVDLGGHFAHFLNSTCTEKSSATC